MNWSGLLAIAEEAAILGREIGDPISKIWMVTGDKELSNVFKIAGKDRGNLEFYHPDALSRDITRMADEISQSTGRYIEKAVNRGLQQGFSVDDIAAEITQIVAFSQMRAVRIARTESTRAVNAATNQAYRQAKAEGIELKKQWLSSRDDKVREAHRELDGQIVEVDGVFRVDGEEAESVGDFGSSGLDVNCRCTILPVLGDD